MSTDEQNSQVENKIYESIKSVFDLTARIDERVQIIIKRQDNTEHKFSDINQVINDINLQLGLLKEANNGLRDLKSSLNGIGQTINEVDKKVDDLEIRVTLLEKSTENQEGRWKTSMNFVLQIVWVILAAWILYKLGIQAPAVP